MAQFQRYIGIDYSGAETPTSSLSGLRVYDAGNERQPSRSFGLISKAQSQSRRTPVCHGFSISGNIVQIEFTSGRSTAGIFRQENRQSLRCILRSGCDAFRMTEIVTQTSKPLTLCPLGYGGRTSTARRRFFHPPLDPKEQLAAQVEGWILGVT